MRFLKPLTVVALALTIAATTIATADAGGRRHYKHRDHSGRNLAIGLVTGLAAGAILYNATRPRHYNPGVSVTYSPSYDEEVCYRGPKQCHSRWNCWVNSYGRELCERQVTCRRPLICE